jgi:hypothetical protein
MAAIDVKLPHALDDADSIGRIADLNAESGPERQRGASHSDVASSSRRPFGARSAGKLRQHDVAETIERRLALVTWPQRKPPARFGGAQNQDMDVSATSDFFAIAQRANT